MDCVSPILDVAVRLWDCTSNRMVYIRDFHMNLESLRRAMNELKNLTQDVKRRVEEAEKQQMRHTDQVKGWLDCVEAMEMEVDEVLRLGAQEIQEKCLGTCPRNCWSTYKHGKTLIKKLDRVKELLDKGRFEAVAYELPREQVDELPMERTVGMKSMVDKVWRSIEEENVGVIGLYGMGGAGKTTLLKKINNDFLRRTHSFDVVIWVVVSKEADMELVQEVCRKKLGIADHIWNGKSKDEKGAQIYKVMRRKKFVLLLDDIWERLDLQQVGIPLPITSSENQSKVLFTTRSEEVCGYMEAHKKIKVECLTRREAFDLFRMKVGEDTLKSHQDIPKLAEIVAEECQGLPLALITIGRAMVSRKSPQEWKHAIKVLKSSPSEFSGIGNHVFPLLEFSYNSLCDATHKNCFLHCSIFPEGLRIRKVELVELWIADGYLDEYDDIYEARNRGEYIIGSLKLACLLESSDSEEFVKMHDVIRDMALWLACEHGQKKHKILVQERDGWMKSQGFAKWREAERISIWGHHHYVQNLTQTPFCPNILTLLVKDTLLKTFPRGFFQNAQKLVSLDLSGNIFLTELPCGIGDLINLQYLNLSRTCIKELSTEVKNLTKLRCLLLNLNGVVTEIPRDVISCLSNLQAFGNVTRHGHSMMQYCNDERALLEDLECLENMNDLSFTISYASSATKIFNSPKLQKCIRYLVLEKCLDLTSINVSSSSLRRMEHLECFMIYGCHQLKELKVHLDIPYESKYFLNLRFVGIYGCHSQLEVTWLKHAPSLQYLSLTDCASIEEVIVGDFEESADLFSSLVSLCLTNLPRLKSICSRALPFPSLVDIKVRNCPHLMKLPFDSESAKNSLRIISGSRNWLEALQWEDEVVKHVFSFKFVHSKASSQQTYSLLILTEFCDHRLP